MTLKKALFAIALGAFSATQASAAVLSATGDGELFGPAPAVVSNGSPAASDNIKAFDEVQDLVLMSDLETDDGTVGAGRVISSHMLFLNREADGPTRVGPYNATFTFSGNVLGVFADRAGQNATDALLGNGIDYSGLTGQSARGLEGSDRYSISGDTITVRFTVTEPGDWLRVVTVAPVPIPAGAVLLPMGLAALGAMRRRKAAKA